MKAKVSSFLSIGFILLMMVGLMGGCGSQVRESKSYHYPTWAPDGRIICAKYVISESKGIWGNYNTVSNKNFITAISSDGATETDLFEISDLAYGGEITCAPDGTKIGYISYPQDKITICNYDGSGKTAIPGVSGASHFDWSPDAKRIAYTANNKLYVSNADGSNPTQIATSSEAVAWRVGDNICYIYESGTDYFKIALINNSGINNKVFPLIGSDPQIIETNEIVYSALGNEVRKVGHDGSNDVLLFNNYQRSTLKLSFDNTKIIGGDLDQQDIVGIWIINIDGMNLIKLR